HRLPHERLAVFMGTFPWPSALSRAPHFTGALRRTASPTSGLRSRIGCTGTPHRNGACHGCRRQQKGPDSRTLPIARARYAPISDHWIAVESLGEVAFVADGSQLDDGLAISGARLRLAQDGGRLLERDPR